MTGDVVNLRQFRKQKARSEKEKQAEQNRLSFGRTKAEKTLTSALNEKAKHSLDQRRLEKGDSSETSENVSRQTRPSRPGILDFVRVNKPRTREN